VPLSLQQGVSHSWSLAGPAHTAKGLGHSQLRDFTGQGPLSLPAARAQNLLFVSELQAEQEPSFWRQSSQAPRPCQTWHLHAQPDKLRLCLCLLGAWGGGWVGCQVPLAVGSEGIWSISFSACVFLCSLLTSSHSFITQWHRPFTSARFLQMPRPLPLASERSSKHCCNSFLQRYLLPQELGSLMLQRQVQHFLSLLQYSSFGNIFGCRHT